jgi:ferritin-like protein
MSSETLHEDAAALSPDVIDQHRAIVSLMEELEAVDWYNQRAKATANPELRAILEHNRDEEKEHAAMVLEWLRRSDPKLTEHLRTYLFTEAPVTEIEAAATEGGGDPLAPASDGSLGIGSLRQVKK